MADEVTQVSEEGEISQTTTTASSGSESATVTETAEFDASTFEVDFGLPEGTLEGVTDGAAAMDRLREYTDKILSAGLMSAAQLTGTQADDTPAPGGAPAAPAPGKTDAKPDAKVAPTDFEAFRASVMQELDSKVDAKVRALQEQAQQQQMMSALQEVDKRIVAEIDSWNSPKYGTKDKRGYRELKAVKELRELAQTQYAGYVSQNKPCPPIETLMRQVRAFHDSDFTPGKKQAAADKKPLGTPGTRGASADDGQPRSIHHAVMSGK